MLAPPRTLALALVVLAAGCTVGSEQAIVDRLDEAPELLEFLPSDLPAESSIVGLNVSRGPDGTIRAVTVTVAANETDLVAICATDSSEAQRDQFCTGQQEEFVRRDGRSLLVVVECASELDAGECTNGLVGEVESLFRSDTPSRATILRFVTS